jgi:hypothetical protein
MIVSSSDSRQIVHKGGYKGYPRKAARLRGFQQSAAGFSADAQPIEVAMQKKMFLSWPTI